MSAPIVSGALTPITRMRLTNTLRQLARVGQRVDRVWRFVAPDRFDPWEPQRETARVPLARLNRVERNLQYGVRPYFEIAAAIADCVPAKMFGQLCDLYIR